MSIEIMMNNIYRLDSRQIYLFDDSYTDHKFRNSLKEFIYYLRFNEYKGVLDFSYASHSDSIHPELSIKDNFILDSVPTSLIKEKEDNLQYNIDKLKNPYLVELISFLTPLDRICRELNQEEIKIASIVKAMLAQTKYIFLEQPDRDLSVYQLERVKNCLKYEVVSNNRAVFLRAYNNDSWLDLATDVITRSLNNEYKRHANHLCQIIDQPAPIPQGQYSFSLLKKVI
jgi:ABC-type multidrug transport system ATPase subunit